MNKRKVKDVIYLALAIPILLCVYKHPFITIGLALVIAAIAVPIMIQLQHKSNLKIIHTKVKKSLNCEYCGSEIMPGTTHCVNCGAVFDLENSKDLVQALEDEKANYDKQTKMSFSISKFFIFLLCLPIIFVMVAFVIALLNDGQLSYSF